jgi:hypothetical protein
MTFSTSVQIYKNYGGSQVFVSRVQTELGKLISRLAKFSRISLTFNPLWNSITSSTMGVRLCMLTRSEWKGHRLPRRTLYPSLSSGGFVLEVTISLSEQFSGNSNLKRNLKLFQSPWGFVRSYNNKKWAKLDLLSRQIFSGFFQWIFEPPINSVQIQNLSSS